MRSTPVSPSHGIAPAKIIMLTNVNNHKNANVNDAGWRGAGTGRDINAQRRSCMGNNNKNNENGHDSNEHEIIGGKHKGGRFRG